MESATTVLFPIIINALLEAFSSARTASFLAWGLWYWDRFSKWLELTTRLKQSLPKVKKHCGDLRPLQPANADVGGVGPSGTWTGAMGAIHRGDADILADIFIIEEDSADAFIWTESVM